MIPKKPAPDSIRGGYRFSERSCSNRDGDSKKSHLALQLTRRIVWFLVRVRSGGVRRIAAKGAGPAHAGESRRAGEALSLVRRRQRELHRFAALLQCRLAAFDGAQRPAQVVLARAQPDDA